MGDWWVTLVFGAGLVVFGSLMIWAHVKTWRWQSASTELTEADRRHYKARYRRRLQTSGLLVLLGVLLPLADAPFVWRQGAAVATVCWIIVLALACWVILLAVADLVATRVHGQAALARLRSKQRALESEASRLRERLNEQRANGWNGRRRSFDQGDHDTKDSE